MPSGCCGPIPTNGRTRPHGVGMVHGRSSDSHSQWNTAILELKDSGRVVQTGEKRVARYRKA